MANQTGLFNWPPWPFKQAETYRKNIENLLHSYYLCFSEHNKLNLVIQHNGMVTNSCSSSGELGEEYMPLAAVIYYRLL